MMKKDKKKESWFATFVNNTFGNKPAFKIPDPTPEEDRRAALELEKEQATKANKAWVAVLDTQVNPDNIKNGFFELDWNNQFIEELLDAGYTGETNEAIVDSWFKSIVVQMLEDEGEETERDMGHIKIVPIDKNKSEVS
jgi:hypothetical protein|tara:strand:- start:1062 stop:1478 length:417 start_codon:yes stop_codon:yes gene_type:complete